LSYFTCSKTSIAANAYIPSFARRAHRPVLAEHEKPSFSLLCASFLPFQAASYGYRLLVIPARFVAFEVVFASSGPLFLVLDDTQVLVVLVIAARSLLRDCSAVSNARHHRSLPSRSVRIPARFSHLLLLPLFPVLDRTSPPLLRGALSSVMSFIQQAGITRGMCEEATTRLRLLI
jgi:hypothetical protein